MKNIMNAVIADMYFSMRKEILSRTDNIDSLILSDDFALLRYRSLIEDELEER